MSLEQPTNRAPEQIPTRLQMGILDGDPLVVDRSELSPIENVAFDYVSWINKMIEEPESGVEERDFMTRARYQYTGKPTFVTPSLFEFTLERAYNGTNSDFLFYKVEWQTQLDTHDISVGFITDILPSLSDDHEDGEEAMRDFILAYTVPNGAVRLASNEQPDQQDLGLFASTLESLQAMLTKDYEIVPLNTP